MLSPHRFAGEGHRGQNPIICIGRDLWAARRGDLRKTMGGWLAQCAGLRQPLYGAAEEVLLQSKVIGTDDTSVKVLDRTLRFAGTGRLWPYYEDKEHPVILHDYNTTRERAGPEKFLAGFRGDLRADAYRGYDDNSATTDRRNYAAVVIVAMHR